MANLLTGEAVFETAMAIEHLARGFYEAVAIVAEDARARAFFAEAARDEARHCGAVRCLRRRWANSRPSDPASLDALEKLEISANRTPLPDSIAASEVAMGGTLIEVVEVAMRLERQSIQVYQGLAACLPEEAESMRQTISEEARHLGRLHALRA